MTSKAEVDRMTRWLDKIKRGTSGDDPIVRLILRRKTEKGSVVVTPYAEITEDFISSVYQDAADDAAGLNNPARTPIEYTVSAYTAGEEDTAKSRATYTLRIQAQGDDGEEGWSTTEAPTFPGLMAQLMRHNEAKERLIANMAMSMTTSAERMSMAFVGQAEAIAELSVGAIAAHKEANLFLAENTIGGAAPDPAFEEMKMEAVRKGSQVLDLVLAKILSKYADS